MALINPERRPTTQRFPSGRRRVGDQLDQVMATEPQEAAISEPGLADEDRLQGGLHAVVDARRQAP